jgi:hypothetical protein
VGESEAECHMPDIAYINWILDHIISVFCDKSLAEFDSITDMKSIKNIWFSAWTLHTSLYHGILHGGILTYRY